MSSLEQADYENYMRKCLSLAQIAKARGDSPVGSILVQNGKVVGEGIEGGKTHQDITFHAEIEAIRNARTALGKTDLSDCTYGAYSFTAVGTEMRHFEDLAASLEDKLFFAGEHTEVDYFSTVHGAYLSGMREAGNIIDLQ